MRDLLLAIFTIIGTGVGVVGILYTVMRNFKSDIKEEIVKLEKRIDSHDERLFYFSTGKTIAQAIIEDKMKKESQS